MKEKSFMVIISIEQGIMSQAGFFQHIYFYFKGVEKGQHV